MRASPKHLGVEAVDLYQIHWPAPEEEIEDGLVRRAEGARVVRPE